MKNLHFFLGLTKPSCTGAVELKEVVSLQEP